MADPGTPASRRTMDWGRVVMIPLGVVGAGVAGLGASRATDLAHVLSSLLTVTFYALLVWGYLRRGSASATARARSARLAAPVATLLPFILPFLGNGRATTPVVISNVLLVVGVAWAIWSIRTLDRSLSVIPQARELVRHGPYAYVRHPLYLGELVASLGLALAAGGPLPIIGWAALVALQAHRAVHEERLLSEALPGYAGYRTSTALLVPGVF